MLKISQVIQLVCRQFHVASEEENINDSWCSRYICFKISAKTSQRFAYDIARKLGMSVVKIVPVTYQRFKILKKKVSPIFCQLFIVHIVIIW